MIRSEDMTIFADVLDRKIPYDSHESDLYIPVTPETTALVREYDVSTATRFISSIDGKPWYDIPFAYDPWWKKRAGRRNPKRGETMREMYAIAYLTGGLLDNIYVFDRRLDAEEAYRSFLADYDEPDDDILLFKLDEDSPGAFSMGEHLRSAYRDKGFD